MTLYHTLHDALRDDGPPVHQLKLSAAVLKDLPETVYVRAKTAHRAKLAFVDGLVVTAKKAKRKDMLDSLLAELQDVRPKLPFPEDE